MSETYRLVQAMTVERLQSAVSAAMADGWLPQGSPQWNERGLCWVQAITRAAQNGERLREPGGKRR